MSQSMDVTETATETPSLDGIIGPDSVMWKVMGHPLVFWVGVTRLGVIAMTVPWAVEAGLTHSGFFKPEKSGQRWQDSIWFFAAVPMGNAVQVRKAIGMVMGRHTTIIGGDPITQVNYDLNTPYLTDDNLYVMTSTHMMLWDSFLLAYDAYVEPVSEADKLRFHREAAEIAVAMKIPREQIPVTREGIDALYQVVSERAAVAMKGKELYEFAFRNPVRSPLTSWINIPAVLRPLLLAAVPALRSLSALSLHIAPEHTRYLLNYRTSWLGRRCTRSFGTTLAKVLARPRIRDRIEKALGEDYHAIQKCARERVAVQH